MAVGRDMGRSNTGDMTSTGMAKTDTGPHGPKIHADCWHNNAQYCAMQTAVMMQQ